MRLNKILDTSSFLMERAYDRGAYAKMCQRAAEPLGRK